MSPPWPAERPPVVQGDRLRRGGDAGAGPQRDQVRHLSGNELHFVNLLIAGLIESGVLEPAGVYDAPFTDMAPEGGGCDVRPRTSLLGLREVDSGANVLLAAPASEVVFDWSRDVDGVHHAAPSQVAIDLLTGPGRSPAEGQALLDRIGNDEPAWRT